MFVSWSAVKRPARPRRPSLPHPLKPSVADDPRPTDNPLDTCPAHSQNCDLDLVSKLCSPSTSASAAQTEPSVAAAVAVAPSQVPQDRPRPRPRSRRSAPPACSEVKVQTLVKLREDGLATLAARAETSQANQWGGQEVSQGSYLQELLEAFSGDHWGFPECHSSEGSQSESEEDNEKEDKENMATLKARIQAFEQQPVSDRSCESSSNEDVDQAKRPEPRPRPRLQPQPAKSPPPTVAPKPKNLSHAPKPSTKLFWEAADSTPAASDSSSLDPLKPAGTLQATSENSQSLSATPVTGSTVPEALLPDTNVPVPAPRPAPPKAETQPRPPPRPAVAPRVSPCPAQQETEASPGNGIPVLPSRSERTQDAGNAAGECFLPSSHRSSSVCRHKH